MTKIIIILSVIAILLFLNGLRKAIFAPRIVFKDVTDVKKQNSEPPDIRISLTRQSYWPPFLKINEVWFRKGSGYSAIYYRESDGFAVYYDDEYLGRTLENCLRVHYMKEDFIK
jgi:hypothetical protein